MAGKNCTFAVVAEVPELEEVAKFKNENITQGNNRALEAVENALG